MNTKIQYLYRDNCNYKMPNSAVVKGTLTEEQKKGIRKSCDCGEYFIPRQVGLPETRFGSITEDDHCWFELQEIEETDAKATELISAEEVYSNFLSAAENWQDDIEL